MTDDWKPVRTALMAGLIFAGLEAAGAVLLAAPLDPTPSWLLIVVSVAGTGLLVALAATVLVTVSRRHAAGLALAAWAAVWGPHQARLGGAHRVGWFPTVVLVGTSMIAPGLGVVLGTLGGTSGSIVRQRGSSQGVVARQKRAARSGDMPDILLITVDTVRSDAGLLQEGRWKPESPFSPMRGWTHFTQAVAPAPWTLPSVYSILTGLPVRKHGGGLPSALGPTRRVGGATPFPYVLQLAGYETSAIVSNPHLSIEHGFADGFDHWTHSDQSAEPMVLMHQWARYKERWTGKVSELRHTRDERIVKRAIEEMALPSERPRFIWVHLLGPHEYRRDPATPVPGWTPETEAPAILKASYKANIDSARHHLRRLTNAADGWVIAVTSDHGETMGEDGRWGHGHRLHDLELRVPLAIRRPGTNGGVVSEPVAVADLGHTLLAAAGEARGFPGGNLYKQRLTPIDVGGVRGDATAFAIRTALGHYLPREADVSGRGVKYTDESQEKLRVLGYTN